MRIVTLSDTHNYHDTYEIPPCDVFIYAGDCTSQGTGNEIKKFAHWINELEVEHKILIGANHDFWFEDKPASIIDQTFWDCTYLLNDSITIEGVKIWGSPYVPNLQNWAFYKTNRELEQNWESVPLDTEILVTHTPPFGIGDYTLPKYGSQHVGCDHLLAKIQQLDKLRLNINGHIHEDAGIRERDGVFFVNTAQHVNIIDYDDEIKIRTMPDAL